MNYTYQEMKSQYEALRKTFAYIMSRQDELLRFYHDAAPQVLTYTGCGSSYYLCQSAEFSARVRLGKAATAIASGDLMLNYRKYAKALSQTLIITPTRSGSTSEVLLAVENIKAAQPNPVLAITCVTGSELAQKADLTLELPWAFDESVCQTRTVTNLYTANLLVLAILAGDTQLIQDIDTAIGLGDRFIAEYETDLQALSAKDWCNAVVLADGELQGIACEGALAFTEIARVPGRYYHLLDVRHGPMVLIDHRTLVIVCLTAAGYEYQAALVADLVKKGALVITYRDIPGESLPGVKLHISTGQELDEAARGIPFIFIAQALAYFKAIHKGVNPDQPEGLDAWIKL